MLAGGFSHSTSLVTLASGPVVVRLGGGRPAIEAAVMARARPHVPTPRVLLADDGEGHGPPVTVLEHALASTLAAIGVERFDTPGFFVDPFLRREAVAPWSAQLADAAEECVRRVPADRLTAAERRAWHALCASAAPALAAVDHDARLVHGDFNPKNVLVRATADGFAVAAVLDWEFAYAGCPYGDAANMMRFADDSPTAFVRGFRDGYGETRPRHGGWEELGRVLDMFALSDLVTRPPGHAVADRAAVETRRRLDGHRTARRARRRNPV